MTDSAHDDEDVPGKAYDVRLLRHLLGYLWPYKRYVLASFVLTTLGAVLAVAGPPLVKAARV